jgi:NO-binding membrane sensor protein with MHYT domain
MPVVHQFAHGILNPAVSYVLAFLGSLLGLNCTVRARAARTRARRARWLGMASTAIGGGIWLMHFMAMLGFDIPATPVRYDPLVTAASAVTSILVVGAGLFIVGTGRRTVGKIVMGGAFTGIGVAAMHYTGMAAMRIQGSIDYEPRIVVASVLIAIVAATVALWLSVAVRGTGPVLTSAAVMGVAVCGMHYTAMYAVHVHLADNGESVPGIDPLALLLPIVVVTMASLIGLVFSALQTATVEDFNAPDRRYLYRGVPLHRYSGKATVPRSPSVASHR